MTYLRYASFATNCRQNGSHYTQDGPILLCNYEKPKVSVIQSAIFLRNLRQCKMSNSWTKSPSYFRECKHMDKSISEFLQQNKSSTKVSVRCNFIMLFGQLSIGLTIFA